MKSKELDILLNQFMLDNELRMERNTINNYVFAAKQLLEVTKKSLYEISTTDVRHWLVHLREEGYNITTIGYKLTAVKTFFHYCMEEGIILTNPAQTIPHPQVGEKIPHYLTRDELNKLRKNVEGRLQERAIVEILYATGIRVSEMCAMKKEDINWEERIIHIPKGKRKKGRIVLFSRESAEHLKAHLKSRTDHFPLVFLLSNKKKERNMYKEKVSEWFRISSKQLGFKVTPHTLRHTFAAHCAQKGMPLECIQALLGHEKAETTRYYAMLFNQARREMYDDFM